MGSGEVSQSRKLSFVQALPTLPFYSVYFYYTNPYIVLILFTHAQNEYCFLQTLESLNALAVTCFFVKVFTPHQIQLC